MPQHLPNPQPVRCHLLSGSHAFEFSAIHFDFRERSPAAEGCIAVSTPFNGDAANPVSHSVHNGDF